MAVGGDKNVGPSPKLALSQLPRASAALCSRVGSGSACWGRHHLCPGTRGPRAPHTAAVSLAVRCSSLSATSSRTPSSMPLGLRTHLSPKPFALSARPQGHVSLPHSSSAPCKTCWCRVAARMAGFEALLLQGFPGKTLPVSGSSGAHTQAFRAPTCSCQFASPRFPGPVTFPPR